MIRLARQNEEILPISLACFNICKKSKTCSSVLPIFFYLGMVVTVRLHPPWLHIVLQNNLPILSLLAGKKSYKMSGTKFTTPTDVSSVDTREGHHHQLYSHYRCIGHCVTGILQIAHKLSFHVQLVNKRHDTDSMTKGEITVIH